MFIPIDVGPNHPLHEQPTIGLIGMGAMGTMYAKHLSDAGWKKYVPSQYSHLLLIRHHPSPKESASLIFPKNTNL